MSKISTIYLMLGPACNMACKHCSQHNIYQNVYNLKPKKDGLSQDVLNFIKGVVADNGRLQIYFWGGEPLLYWETIKETISLFEQNGLNTLLYTIFTNGLLLNDEIIDYCNTRNFSFVLSYDAPNPTALRSEVPGEYNVQCFKRFKGKKRVNSVFTSANPDLVAIDKFITEKFPEKDIEKSIGHFMVLGESGKKTIQFQENEIYEQVSKFMQTERGHNWGKRKIKPFNEEQWRESFYPMCNHGDTVMVFDYYGNCYLCHNGPWIIGHVTDGEDKLRGKYLQQWIENRQEKCFECEARDICQCHCPVALKENGEYCLCNSYREMARAITDYLKKEKVNGYLYWRNGRKIYSKS